MSERSAADGWGATGGTLPLFRSGYRAPSPSPKHNPCSRAVPVLRPITHPAGLGDDDEPEHREYPVQAAEGEAEEGSEKSGVRGAEIERESGGRSDGGRGADVTNRLRRPRDFDKERGACGLQG